MKSFLVSKKDKRPFIKWSKIPDNVFYEGVIPEGYNLGISPSPGYVIIDIDRHGKKNGFDYIPEELKDELYSTLNYPTKNKGQHCWFRYTGDKDLKNTTSNLGIDLRVGQKGYVVFYKPGDIRDYMHLIKDSSHELNKWLEKLFS